MATRRAAPWAAPAEQDLEPFDIETGSLLPPPAGGHDHAHEQSRAGKLLASAACLANRWLPFCGHLCSRRTTEEAEREWAALQAEVVSLRSRLASTEEAHMVASRRLLREERERAAWEAGCEEKVREAEEAAEAAEQAAERYRLEARSEAEAATQAAHAQRLAEAAAQLAAERAQRRATEAGLERELAATKAAEAEAFKQLQAAEAELAARQQQLSEIAAQLESVRAAEAAAAEGRQAAEAQLSLTAQQLADLATQLQTAQAAEAAGQQQLSEVAEQLESVRAAEAAGQQQLSELAAELQHVRTAAAAAESQQAQHAAAEQQLVALAAQLKALEAAKAAADQKLQRGEAQQAAAGAQLSELARQLQATEAKSSALESELQAQQSAAEDKLAKLAQQLRTVQAELSMVQAQLEAERQQRNAAETQLTARQSEDGSRKADLDSLQADLSFMQRELEAARQAKAAAAAEAHALAAELSAAAMERAAAQEALSGAEEDNRDLIAALQTARSDAARMAEALTALQSAGNGGGGGDGGMPAGSGTNSPGSSKGATPASSHFSMDIPLLPGEEPEGGAAESALWDSAADIQQPPNEPMKVSDDGAGQHEGWQAGIDGDEWEQLRAAGMAGGWLAMPAEVRKQRELGRGAFGVTHLASFRGAEAAVKCVRLQPGKQHVFVREVGALARVSHPAVVRLLGAVVEPPSACWLVMEYLPGGTLFAWLHGEGGRGAPKRTMAQKLQMALRIAEGLAALEGADPPVMHRDIKPANVLLDSAGSPKLADFGLCRAHLEDEAYTYTGETGSYTYMAPEVMRGDMYGPSADVYSFAILATEIVKQRPPFEECYLQPAQIAEQTAYGGLRPQLPGGLPGGLAPLLEACWDDEPEMRPPFSVVVPELRQIIEHLPPAKRGLFG